MAYWTVKTYHKKNVEQHETFFQREGNGKIKVTDGFRWASFTIETDDDEFPQFEFEQVPGGDGKNDSLNLFSCEANNIISSEMIEMYDGGCWGDIDIEGIEDEEELEKLNEFIEENGSYALEDEGDWYLDETECWVWGPIEVTNDETGESRIIIADADGNVTDFKDE